MMEKSPPPSVGDATGRETIQRVASKRLPGPDRGWAWVVAFACFSINFILSGLARSSGVLYVSLIDLYGVSREAATTPFSMRVCIRNLFGPVVGMLGQRYGIRPITVIGGVLSGIGGILCYFAPNVFWLTMFWGVINGIGFGLATVIHMMAINHYFDKYKGMATGLGYSGDCIGTFVLPVVIEYLIATYGVKESFLLIAAVILHVIPMAMLLRPPIWKQDSMNLETSVGIANKGFAPGSMMNLEEKQVFFGDGESSESDIFVVSQSIPKVHQHHILMPVNDDPHYRHLHDDLDEKAVLKQNEAVSCAVIGANSNARDIGESPGKESSFIPATIDSQSINSPCCCIKALSENGMQAIKAKDSDCSTCVPQNSVETLCHCDAARQQLKKCDSVTEIRLVSRSSSISNRSSMTATIRDNCSTEANETCIKIRALSETLRNRSNSNRSMNKGVHVGQQLTQKKSVRSRSGSVRNRDVIEVSRELANSGHFHPVLRISYENQEQDSDKKKQSSEICLDARELMSADGQRELEITAQLKGDSSLQDDTTATRSGLVEELLAALRKLYYTNRKPMYLLICFTWAAYVLMFVSVITVIIDFGLDKGIAESDGKYLIIALSAADFVGRLAFGIVIDKAWIEMRNYMGLTVGLMGFVVAVMPFLDGFIVLMLSMTVFGFIQGGGAIVYPILIEKYMHQNEQSIAMGCLSFYGGILMFAMAPMIGFFRDIYGSYDGMFYIDGIMTLCLGLMWFLEPLIVKCQMNLCEKYEDN